MPNPTRKVRVIVQDSGDPGYTNRLLVGTPCTGNVRVEWVAARYGQLIPLNWSMGTVMQAMGGYMPLRYQVAEAQNLICAQAIKMDVEWLLLLEHDVIVPPDTFVRLNEYMRSAKYPVVSGLYFSRAYPSEPMVFRGMGEGAYVDFRKGDLVWCDGVPTGCLLLHMSLVRALWEDSQPEVIKGIATRQVFDTPRHSWFNPETGMLNYSAGTSDLEFCKRVIQGGYLKTLGWNMPDPAHPFLMDTNIFCGHINPDGTVFPDLITRKHFEGSHEPTVS